MGDFFNSDFKFEVEDDQNYTKPSWDMSNALRDCDIKTQFKTNTDQKIENKLKNKKFQNTYNFSDNVKKSQHNEIKNKLDEIEQLVSKKVKTNSSNAVSSSEEAKKFYKSDMEGVEFDAAYFTDLKLSKQLVKACSNMGYYRPTPVQAACVPLALLGRDICGSAITGSGKTAAYALPLLERLLHRPTQFKTTYVLIITPTRELAIQVHSMMENLAKFCDVDIVMAVGGFPMQNQEYKLKKRPEIVIATPGRLLDHLRNPNAFDLDDLRALVLDEADKLLKLGFKDELEAIIKIIPEKRQTMLFSATMTEEVKKLMKLSLKNPVRLAADPVSAAPKTLSQEIIRLKGKEYRKKDSILCALCSRTFVNGKVLVFFATRRKLHEIKVLFGLLKLPSTGELHGNMTQLERINSLDKFRKGEINYLFATDVASRGLDVMGVEVVINFDAPNDKETYIHRVGRTARAGEVGKSISFITDKDKNLLKIITKKITPDLKLRTVPKEIIKYFDDAIRNVETEKKEIKMEEKFEKKLKDSEKQLEYLENMLMSENPELDLDKRPWFQTKQQKRHLNKLDKMESEGHGSNEDELKLNLKIINESKKLASLYNKTSKEEAAYISKMKFKMEELKEQGMSFKDINDALFNQRYRRKRKLENLQSKYENKFKRINRGGFKKK